MSRPLSPHIFIYKPQISSLFSVMHRASGVILSLAFLFIPFFLELFSFCLSYYPFYLFAVALETFASWLVISAFIFLFFSLFYHLFNGIRHLLWDFFSTSTLEISKIQSSAYLVIFLTLTCVLLLILAF